MTALTIAGFDPSSGAGITADLQVFAAHDVFGTSAITALTVQSTLGVRRVDCVSEQLLAQTLRTLEEDLPPDGIKIGMLGSASQVREVIQYLRSVPGRPVVLDPVIRSSSGTALLDAAGVDLMREELLPLVQVVTPNLAELAILGQTACGNQEQVKQAVLDLSLRSGASLIVTGGDQPTPDDHVYADGVWHTLPGQHIETQSTHGTGCAFSSAVLCGLLAGRSVPESAAAAKAYVATAIRTATPRGRGKGPMNLLWCRMGHAE